MEYKTILQKDIPERNHLTDNIINKLDNSFFLECIMYIFTAKNQMIKPLGMWYSIKWYWIENLSLSWDYMSINYNEEPNKEYPLGNDYLYEVVLSDNVFTNLNHKGLGKILLLSNYEDFELFYDLYKLDDNTSSWERIDWRKVYIDYGGIELTDIHLDELLKKKSWWYGWDIPSGCIWNKDLIKKITLVI